MKHKINPKKEFEVWVHIAPFGFNEPEDEETHDRVGEASMIFARFEVEEGDSPETALALAEETIRELTEMAGSSAERKQFFNTLLRFDKALGRWFDE